MISRKKRRWNIMIEKKKAQWDGRVWPLRQTGPLEVSSERIEVRRLGFRIANQTSQSLGVALVSFPCDGGNGGTLFGRCHEDECGPDLHNSMHNSCVSLCLFSFFYFLLSSLGASPSRKKLKGREGKAPFVIMKKRMARSNPFPPSLLAFPPFCLGVFSL